MKIINHIIAFILCAFGIIGIFCSFIPAFTFENYRTGVLVSIVGFIVSAGILAVGVIWGIKSEER
jgi:branched-subunit amino acid transport protein AzlD